MAFWRVAGVDEAPSADFSAELYGEVELKCEQLDGGDADIGEECDMDDEDEPYSPLQRRPVESAAVRDRSRSPIIIIENPVSDPQPSTSWGVVVEVFDSEGRLLCGVDDTAKDCAGVEEGEEDFFSPNAHALYARMDESEGVRDASVKRARVQGGRRGCRGRRRARRGRGGGRRRRVDGQQCQWVVGHPLEEIWITDDDVPSELRELAKDVVRRREVRMQEMRDRAARNLRQRERKVEEEESGTEEEDEFQDATDGRGNPLLEGEDLFEWSPMDSFQPIEESFTPERTGSVECHQTPYSAFRSFWDDNVMERIVGETNQYASEISSDTFQSDWSPTNAHELLCLFAFWMMLGIVRMPTIRSCFSTDPLLKTAIFRKIFTEKRYNNLNRAWNFIGTNPANLTNSDPATSSDQLSRLRPILTHLNAKFQANYIPSKDICIDESLTLWMGRLNFRQYIRSKAAKLGIKTFELCESSTGYLWSFIVYTGKQSSLDLQQGPHVLKSTAIVKSLIGPLLNKGHRLFMDNWYNSPLLARFLKRNGTDCVGTLRPCRQDVPALINQAPLKQGQLVARHSGDVCVLSWQDTKRITMISTCHGSAAGLAQVPSKPGTRPLPFKPQVVLDYNRSMGGVDLKDQMLEPYLIERKKCAKWYTKLFKRLLNVSILNARILLESSLQCGQDHLNFRLRLVDAILANHLSHCPQSRRANAAISRVPNSLRFVPNIHWPVLFEGLTTQGRKTRLRCVQCRSEGRSEIRTAYKCEGCDVPLCVKSCFKKYHIK